jgi:hypothetical protein
LLLFMIHFTLLLFVVLPFAFWYLALRGANKIFRVRAMEPGRSIQAQRFHFFAKIIPMNIYLWLAPIFFINTLIPNWSGHVRRRYDILLEILSHYCNYRSSVVTIVR